MQRLNFIAVAEGHETRLRMGALIESEDEGAIETRGVVGTGSVAKMVIEAREPWAAAEKRLEKVLEGGARGALAAGARMPERRAALGESNGAAVRQLQLIFVQAARQGEARDFERVLQTIELLFFDGEENGLFVEKRDRGAPTDGGNAKYSHEIGSARCRSRKDRLERQSTKIFAFGAGDGSRQELIGRQSKRELNREIIFGERGREGRIVFGIAAQGKDTKGAADLCGAKLGGFGFREGAQFARAAFDDAAGNPIGQSNRFCAGALGIGEDVQVGEGPLCNETQCGGVVGFGLAGEPGDDVGADSSMGKAFVNEFDAAGVMFGAVPAMHGREDAVRSGLQGHVEVGRETLAGGNEIDEGERNVERLDGADAEALDGSFVEDAAKEVEECDARREIATVGAEIDAAENDFAIAGIGETLNFSDNLFGRQAAGFPAHERNHAKRAAGVAAVLNFQRGARVIPFPAEHGGNENFGEIEDVAGEDFCDVVRAAYLRQWCQMGRSVLRPYGWH